MKIPLQEAVAALQATGIGTLPSDIACSIDTRSIQNGQTYLALVGESFDGHAFLGAAQKAGAAAAIVSDPSILPHDLPALHVANTHTALLALAGVARAHFCGAVIAITGSAGKTTTKTFLAQMLTRARIGEIAATPQNENNEIGVSKVLLALQSEAAVVIEMGARNPHDIAPLVAIARPHVAVLTNIGEAHIGIFGSREALAQTKWELFGGGALAVLSLADAESRARYTTLTEAPLFCGLHGDQLLSDVATLMLDGREVTWQKLQGETERAVLEHLPPGEHNVRNLLAACGAALLIGVPLGVVTKAASGFAMPHGRYERVSTPFGATIIHDAYNASPSGTLATLKAFSQESGRRIVVLGSMAELGDEAPQAHRRVGAALAETGAAKIFLGGEFAAELEAGALQAGVDAALIERFENNASATESLRQMLQSGDVVVVKGSRMYRLEQIIDALTASVQPA